MGAKPVFKRYKNPVYITFCIIIALFLSSCQNFSQLRTLSTSVDTNEKKYLATTRKLVLNKDFKSAAKENQHVLKYYRRIPDMDDIILSNYVENAQIISDLLIRIMDDEEKKLALYGKILLNEEQIKVLTLKAGSLKKKADAQKKKLEDMDMLFGKIKTLENEKKLLQKQIDRLKEIDLNPDKIIGNPIPSGPKHPSEKLAPIINNTL